MNVRLPRQLNQINQFVISNANWCIPLLILGYILLITGLWLPFHWTKYGSLDHSLTYTSYEAIRLLVFKYGQFPLFLQNINGGLDLWADPQSMTLGFFNVFPLLFGAIIGHKLAVISAYFIGMYSAYHLSRKLYHHHTIGLLIALCYGSVGYFAHHIIQAGHSNFLYFHLLPLLVYFILHQFRNGVRWTTSAAIVIIYAQMVLGGALPVLLITLTCLIPLLFSFTWDKFGFTIFQLSLGIGSLLLMGIKIYPFLDVFGSSPRVFQDTAGINLQELWMAVSGHPPLNSSGSFTFHGWWEHGIGIGFIIPILALIVLPLVKNWKLILSILVLLIWFGMGDSPKNFNPWQFANSYLFGFENFRAPFRFLIGPFLTILFIIPFGLQKNANWTRLFGIALIISLMYGTSSVLSISRSFTNSKKIETYDALFEAKKNNQVISVTPELEPIQYRLLANDNYLVNTLYPLLDNVSHTEKTSFIEGGTIISNKQKELSISANSDSIRLLLTYSPYWESSAGNTVNNDGKLMITDVENSTITLRYKPKYWKMAWGISLIGLVLLLVVIFLGRKFLTASAPSS